MSSLEGADGGKRKEGLSGLARALRVVGSIRRKNQFFLKSQKMTDVGGLIKYTLTTKASRSLQGERKYTLIMK